MALFHLRILEKMVMMYPDFLDNPPYPLDHIHSFSMFGDGPMPYTFRIQMDDGCTSGEIFADCFRQQINWHSDGHTYFQQVIHCNTSSNC